MPRPENKMVDALANLVASAPYSCHVELNVLAQPIPLGMSINTTKVVAVSSWMMLIISYLKHRSLLENNKDVYQIKARVARYALINDILFRKSFSGPYQCYVLPKAALQIIWEVNNRIYDTHISGQSICHRIMT